MKDPTPKDYRESVDHLVQKGKITEKQGQELKWAASENPASSGRPTTFNTSPRRPKTQ